MLKRLALAIAGAVLSALLVSTPSVALTTPSTTDLPTSVLTPNLAPLRVLPLGDSITYGVGSGASTFASGYRGPLQRLLEGSDRGYGYDFVGPYRTGHASVDVDHAGYIGFRIDQLQVYASKWVGDARPDVVLLHIGTNDMNQNYMTATAPDRLRTLIDTVRSASPAGVKIIVAQIAPSPNKNIHDRVAAYNEGVQKVVDQESAEHGDTYLVDMFNALTPTSGTGDFADYLHPNDNGYNKMARVWNETLSQLEFTPNLAPLRVLPLGDSITYGVGSGASTFASGYRGPLQRLLEGSDRGYGYDFVGPYRTGHASVDVDHAGYIGFRIDQLQVYASKWVGDARPDVVLLHIGTNDMNQNYMTATAPDRLRTLIDTVRSASPAGVKIIVAQIAPSPNKNIHDRVAAYNEGVQKVVDQESAEHGDTYLVDMFNALTPTSGTGDFADYLHPNDNGYNKMARVWNETLSQLMQ
ncbi:SGNH/GDSL hydrolase family protein [Microbacterium sp. KSW4-16]|uniref:SGNH/GDSL hydrolase family protein n=1 Tax=Microbacterium aurugineum TaxID=2851642 RepID=UPI0020BF84FA|nr:SGNH/GDSL hydrolase family protein [Microbacterium aurugineum]MCK8469047.1 SGNH/GDSL hydrolase family protein [Microbacterium aurugineum]